MSDLPRTRLLLHDTGSSPGGNDDDAAAPGLVWSSVICAALLWLTFPFVTLTTKCLLTKEQCTRWGPAQGANFDHPVTAASLHLLITGTVLLISNMCIRPAVWAYCSHRFTHLTMQQQQRPRGKDHTVQCQQQQHPLGLKKRLCVCAAVGVAFGTKYCVGHYALRATPAAIYELFHCINIVFVAVLAHCILGESLSTRGEIGGCIGVVVGSFVMAASQTGVLFQVDENGRVTNAWVLALNLANGILAGMTVVLLRSAMLKFGASSTCVVSVTAYKLVVAAAVVVPFAIVIEDVYSVLLAMTAQQLQWLCISSGAILLYHVNLSVICYVASAPTVAIVEALRPLPAFAIIALLQSIPHNNVCFWIGSIVILISAIGFELSRRFCRVACHHQKTVVGGDSSVDKIIVCETMPLKVHPQNCSDRTDTTWLTDSALSDFNDTA